AVIDNGPGIADLESAMTPGFHTGRDQGGGLLGAKRLVDNFHVVTRPGKTTVSFSMARKL
ncbi:MAG: anti-sigma regulatory factor, partial [Alphaproteobacteria bacterium]|nr:anti-sigma regulatory factor [Alphaproteobacteria bacterium]